MSRILIVENEASLRQALKDLLERQAYHVAIAASLDAAQALAPQTFDLVICDLRLAGEDGTQMLALSAPIPVLVMTDHSSLRKAVIALKEGAVDCIAKPVDDDDVLATVSRVLSRPAPREASRPSGVPRGMIGECAAMQRVYERIRKTAPADVTVLVQGESGTGKELVARALHRQSRRTKAPLICVNCAAIPETLIESELFGHEKGAFTGANSARTGLVEAADGGTLFLDEIGELPLDAQARLLRVLQEGEIRRIGSVETRYVDVRLIAATHRDLHSLSRSGEFRLDLYYRLNVMQIELPPLREREDDILSIAQTLLERACTRHARPGLRLSRAARRDILGYAWPGNVRELENALERGVILAEGYLIHPDDLGLPLERRQEPPAASPEPSDAAEEDGVPDDDLSLEDYFQHFVLEHQAQMSETELAQKLGISRKCLWERRQRLGIPRKKSARRPA
ncbi:two-component response regulator CbrB [Chromohalobacter marismortui]|uniref:Two-component response regulator CbrB n=1 Tax=Chromohalobacter marismortui TaxID=42055 RepID=A0A4R7NF26_9GAMM|nr:MULTISPECIES: sigma-54 dependent transcriptional regulator [Chromohalobacter]MCI0510089.1 sigma-54 dependent transcriptional regulator [Chromohalobacter sp.]MCI0593734.1 sigma-54 dependent transcriptional regulator [Chromohalobacter sp.]TDU18942.1 two-component response regulator CbrB [Chromohalobacter marismortui]